MRNDSALVEPYYRSTPQDRWTTYGPDVADLCDVVGFSPDPEQRLVLDDAFAVDRRGKACSFEVCVICARQNMKTGLLKQMALGWLFITDQQLIIWSAHEFSTAQEAFRDMELLIEGSSFLSKRVKKIHRANGDEAIELRTGARLKFRARTKAGGRGLSGDKVVLDEAFALQPDHMGALLPTLSVRPDPQVIYGSSAGVAHSDVLRKIRDRGRAGSSPRLAYCEWCAPVLACASEKCDHEPGKWAGCQLDDRDNWKQANPLLGRIRANGTGLTEGYVAAEREALPPAEFARERMGWWDDPSTSDIFGPGKWEQGAREDDERPADLKMTGLAVAVAMDLKSAALVGAGVDDAGRVWPRVLQHGPGTAWTVDRAHELQARFEVPLVIDGKGPGAMLIPTLEREGVELHVATTSDVLDAFANLRSRVSDGALLHTPAPELDAAVAGAALRPVGDRFAIGRKASTADVSPLEATSLAAWQATIGPTTAPSVYETRGVMTI
ncbi:hypothetical protein AB0302_04525 [Micrococcus sp. NPDC078436]|uniref:hypothetical protein n=1 Tax=Micrococcus sp. NPDC078436 TaxID=3154960 RepID=UPI00344FB09E